MEIETIIGVVAGIVGIPAIGMKVASIIKKARPWIKAGKEIYEVVDAIEAAAKDDDFTEEELMNIGREAWQAYKAIKKLKGD